MPTAIIQLNGKKGATYAGSVQNWDSRTSWARLDDHNTKPNRDILKLDRFVDWEKGDRVVVTTTDYLPGHSEERKLSSRVRQSASEICESPS
jgi:hypothetical protein